ATAQAKTAVPFHVQLSFLQRFRAVDDGATFEEVFTGVTERGDPNNAAFGETNLFKGAGTLGVAFRKYVESPGFAKIEPGKVAHSFTTPYQIEVNTGMAHRLVAHWNLTPGGPPIRWLISDQVGSLGEPYKDYDLAGAIKAGVEAWNDVLGWKALAA